MIVGTLVIAAILASGFMKKLRGRNNLKMKLDKAYASKLGEADAFDDRSLTEAELPHGGARVIAGSGETPPDIVALEETGLKKTTAAGEDPADSPTTPVRTHGPEGAASAPGSGNTAPAKPEKLVVIHVLAQDSLFEGQKLLEALRQTAMTFGDMGIFHRTGDKGVPEFSLANLVKPGSFDMARMDSFSTPGVSLFMRAHELSEPLRVFDDMVEAAETIGKELTGTLQDETRSAMTPQTLEHYRRSLREYQLRYDS